MPGAEGSAADADQCFGPDRRLHTGRDYGRVFHRQQKAGGRWAVLLMAPRAARGRSARLGVMVSAKVAKRAVRRHQLKRWVRELCRRELLARAPGMDMVVLIHRDPPPDGHVALDAELRTLLARALVAPAQPGSGRGPRRGRGRGQKLSRPCRPGPSA